MAGFGLIKPTYISHFMPSFLLETCVKLPKENCKSSCFIIKFHYYNGYLASSNSGLYTTIKPSKYILEFLSYKYAEDLISIIIESSSINNYVYKYLNNYSIERRFF